MNGPLLLTATQIDELPKGSIIETVDRSTHSVYHRGGDGWYGSGSSKRFGNDFPIGKTYLVREGRLTG